MAKKNKEISRVNTGAIVLSALKKLMKKTGWTTRTIVKFIKAEYTISDPNLGRKVSRALKNYSRRGLIRNERGRYRLRHVSRMVKCRSSSDHKIREPCHMRRRMTKRRDRPSNCSLRIRSRTPSRERRR